MKLSDQDAALNVMAEVMVKRREHEAIMRTMQENAFTVFVMLFAFSSIAVNSYWPAVGAVIVLAADTIYTKVLYAHAMDLNRAILNRMAEVFRSLAPPGVSGEEWRRDQAP